MAFSSPGKRYLGFEPTAKSPQCHDVRWNPQRGMASEHIPSNGLMFHGTCAAVWNLPPKSFGFCSKKLHTRSETSWSKQKPNSSISVKITYGTQCRLLFSPPDGGAIEFQGVHHVTFAGELPRASGKTLLQTIDQHAQRHKWAECLVEHLEPAEKGKGTSAGTSEVSHLSRPVAP